MSGFIFFSYSYKQILQVIIGHFFTCNARINKTIKWHCSNPRAGEPLNSDVKLGYHHSLKLQQALNQFMISYQTRITGFLYGG
jgi:hypothetical protein